MKFLFLLWIIQTVLIGATNFVLRDILQIINSDKYYKKTKVAIYGASSKGAQLAASIRLDFNYKIIAFFDDRKSLYNVSITQQFEVPKNDNNAKAYAAPTTTVYTLS